MTTTASVKQSTGQSDSRPNSQSIYVERAIVHNVIPLDSSEPFLSEADLELTSELKKYLEAQIANVLFDSQTGKALFSPDGSQETATRCYDILGTDGTGAFIPASRQLAQLLFFAMGKDGRVKPGSLVVCVYHTLTDPKKPQLAMLKLDLGEVILQSPREDKKGHRVVELEVRDNGLPSPREKLHKAAIVRPKKRGAESELLLLDRQVPTVADYFARKFLNVVPAFDPREATERFYVGAQNAYNRLRKPPVAGKPHLEPIHADALLQHIETALQSEEIDIQPWGGNLPISQEAKELVLEEINKQLPETGSVTVDLQHAQKKLLNTKRFRGDYGVLFEVQADHYRDVVKDEEEVHLNGETITRLVLEVSGLRWVK